MTVDLSAVDWEALLVEAGYHDVMPLLHYRLQARPELKAAIPAQILERIHNGLLKNTAYISLFYCELQQILSVCAQEGINVILLKGAYLAKQVYPGMGLRPMSDMDLLVKPADLQRACVITEKLGYTTSHSYSQKVEMEFHRHMPIYKKGGFFAIEWHWQINEPGSPYDIKTDELWEQAIPMEISGLPCFGLAREDLLLHLALHLTGQHTFSLPLRSLVDIDILLRVDSQRIDWQVVIDRARHSHLERCLYLTLRLAQECFGTPLPEMLLITLLPGQVEEDVIGWAYEELFTARIDWSQQTITNYLKHVWQRDGLVKLLRKSWARVCYYPQWFCILIRKRYNWREVMRPGKEDQAQRAVQERLMNKDDRNDG